jgi:excisionase family DNA binding protein
MRKSVRAVEAWMREGSIPFYRLGQAVRFRWSEVQAHFAAQYRVAASDDGKDRKDGKDPQDASGQRTNQFNNQP